MELVLRVLSCVVFFLASNSLNASNEKETKWLHRKAIDPGKKAFYSLQLISGNKEKFVNRFPKFEKDITRAKGTNLYGKASYLTFQIQYTINVRNSVPKLSNILAAKRMFVKLKEQKAVELLTIFEANYYFQTKDYSKSARLYETIYPKIKKRFWADKYDLMGSSNYYLLLGNIAYNYYRLNDSQKSIEYLNELLHSIDQKTQSNEYSLALSNLGSIYSKEKKEKKAIFFYKKALELVKKNNFKEQYNINEFNISKSYLNLKNYKEAREFISKMVFLDSTDSSSIINLSLTSVLLQEINIAIETKDFVFAKKKMAILSKLPKDDISPENRIKMYSYYSKVYESENNIPLAFSNYKKWVNEYESVRTSEFESYNSIQRKFLSLEKQRIKTELEHSSNKKNESLRNTIQIVSIFIGVLIILILIYLISRLVKLNKKLFQKTKSNADFNKKLIISLKDKEILLQEVHHRVKNNFQIISSLLNIQANQLSNAEEMRPLLDAKDRILSMSLVHQKLYAEKRNELEKVLFGEYLVELITNIRSIYCEKEEELVLTTQFDEIFVDLNKAVPLALFSNEVITNSFKYGRDEQGILHLNIKLIDKGAYQTELVFNDTGIGFNDLPQDSVDSIGSQLKSLLAEQLNGKLLEYNENGAVVNLKFFNIPDELKTI